MTEDKIEKIKQKIFDQCCKKVASEEGLGHNLVTGHRRTYYDKAVSMAMEEYIKYLKYEKTVPIGDVFEGLGNKQNGPIEL